MKFEEALKHLREGKKIRRQSWVSMYYIFINNVRINNDCDTIRVVNPKPPKIQ